MNVSLFLRYYIIICTNVQALYHTLNLINQIYYQSIFILHSITTLEHVFHTGIFSLDLSKREPSIKVVKTDSIQ